MLHIQEQQLLREKRRMILSCRFTDIAPFPDEIVSAKCGAS